MSQGDSVWTVLTAIATTLAVLVALFGPGVYDAYKRRRNTPILTLTAEGGNRAHRVSRDGRQQNTIWLDIANATARDRAEQVELFATILGYRLNGAIGGAGDHDYDEWVCTQSRVSFTDALVSSIAANFRRRARLGVLRAPVVGADDQVAAGEWHVERDGPPPIHPGMRYEIELALTGANFDAQHYKAELTVLSGPKGRAVDVEYTWTTVPSPIRGLELRPAP